MLGLPGIGRTVGPAPQALSVNQIVIKLSCGVGRRAKRPQNGQRKGAGWYLTSRVGETAVSCGDGRRRARVGVLLSPRTQTTSRPVHWATAYHLLCLSPRPRTHSLYCIDSGKLAWAQVEQQWWCDLSLRSAACLKRPTPCSQQTRGDSVPTPPRAQLERTRLVSRTRAYVLQRPVVPPPFPTESNTPGEKENACAWYPLLCVRTRARM